MALECPHAPKNELGIEWACMLPVGHAGLHEAPPFTDHKWQGPRKVKAEQLRCAARMCRRADGHAGPHGVNAKPKTEHMFNAGPIPKGPMLVADAAARPGWGGAVEKVIMPDGRIRFRPVPVQPVVAWDELRLDKSEPVVYGPPKPWDTQTRRRVAAERVAERLAASKERKAK